MSIEALPPATKQAMLEGVRSGPIIAGAYTSPDGTCPMLAAHRRGGRTSLDTFARAWDGYTRAHRPRLVTERELRTLRSMLEASLGEGEAAATGALGRAIAEHRQVREREARSAAAEAAPAIRPAASRRTHATAPGDPDRSRELRGRPGWAWLRVFRRLDDYEAALAQTRTQEAGGSKRPAALAGASSN
ncbi:MAG: hypothetical protein AVDCRST_MAG45-2064 [uncultured Solirubrobacterales bacterium]|uniref:Uncharacterized protein n=1 Tax=uncultured Solirubrobacterales bacterium TaxID=768556 RepID=A0A6J4T4L0_9ACTN|nr:MAG: hypothetical protein AVDCRST_MAG45-2064 [uncultured Solirubrobacterales bacterium]